MPDGFGERGPIPSRSDERRRRNKPEVETEVIDLTDFIAEPVHIPLPDEKWHPLVRELWDAAKRSGQSVHYEPTDWALLKVFCYNLSLELKPQFVGFEDRWSREANEMEHVARHETIPIKGGNLSAMLKLAYTLMLTEGDRRRLRLELNRPQPTEGEAGTVTDITAQRHGLLG